MAEFPGLGDHCSVPECRILDFLPVKCDACAAILCRNHITYESHRCTSGQKKNIQVPVCPLCSQPVPTGRNELPDIKVNEHIDRDCKSDPAQRRRKRELQCSMLGCRKRELVRILCQNCRRNFCLTHRHTTEHDCRGTRENPGLKKLTSPMQSDYSTRSMTDNDEALAQALHAAMNGGVPPKAKVDPDEMSRQLAMQLQEEEYRGSNSASTNSQQRCSIS